jgi:hypothetical protein
MSKPKKRISSRVAFENAWRRHAPLKDSWGVECVYADGAYKMFMAGARFAKSQATSGVAHEK